MALSKEERIERLKRGIESPSTPESIKEQMRETLEELENPPVEPEPLPTPVPAVKVKTPLVMVLPHHTYFTENGIDEKSLPNEIGQQLRGLKMLMGRDTEKIRIKAVEISNRIIEMVKKHLTPPPPPTKVFTQEEKEAQVAEYNRRLAKRREALND